MKIYCDVCSTEPATLMCCADDAALCSQCDTRVHAANKLASKHQRVPLLTPGPGDAGPRCDICQEKTGYVFCLEDRALLCRICDVSIHSTNTLASNHKRYLVTGIRVGLQATSGQNCPFSTGIAQVCSQRQVSTQSRSAGKGSSFFNVADQSSTPGSQHTATSLGSQSFQTRSTNSSTQPASSLYVSPSAAQQLSHGSVAPAEGSGDSPVAGPPPVHEISIPSRRLPVIEEMRLDTVISKQSNGEGLMKKNSLSEYFSETISGWKVDELLNFTDTVQMGNSKRDVLSFEDAGWNADFSDIDENLFRDSFAEVPSLPSPAAAASGPQNTGTLKGSWKGKRPSDSTFLFGYDDYLVVPESVSPVPPPPKRRIGFLEV